MNAGEDTDGGPLESVVDAQGLEKTYGETVALSSVALSVDRGSVFGLLGPNGAGKTTLVRALTGTTELDSGSVRILGSEPRTVDRNRISVLPQAFSPPDRLTARELLTYYASLYDEARDPERVLADVGLADDGETWYENLSGGQQRRVCVGAAIINDPDLLFLDEPTTGIDPAGRRTVWGLLEGLAERGTTIILTTHDMAEAEHLADRVGLLADGRLVATGTPSALIAEHGGSSRLTIDLEAETEGGHSATASRVDDPVSEPPSLERAREAVADLEYTTTREKGALVIHDLPPARIGAVVDALDDAKVAYNGLSWAEPDLEDVYLAVAGDTERRATTHSATLEGGPSTAGDVR
ncbi:ABC transporter ATP-binding protein [Natronosalvus amylolyticus]|uniref:ABC transporter ATP-binding protein n=1 Tax=Natronosalvus amylolyticus TaxID=2961994 RepID=UPI0020C9B799|nr:ABC transporter ATP-binding protein [Natronosalvus amylolyticus]